MTQPKTIEWEIGQDIHARSVTLRQSKDYMGRISFSIISTPSSQLDEGEQTHSLSRENLVRIAQIEGAMK